MGKKRINQINPPCDNQHEPPYNTTNRYEEYLSLLMNAVRIKMKGSGETLPFVKERFAKRTMFEGCAVGYSKITQEFYNVVSQGVDDYGNALRYTFITENGKSLVVDACYDDNPDGAYAIYALPDKNISVSSIIKETTDYMKECDIARSQNLQACKTPYVAVCANENLRTSMQTAIREKQEGQAIIIVSPELAEGLKAISFEVPFLVDKFTEARDKERDTLLTKFGILTANSDKKERVQSAEVNATLGEATDYIYMIIDTFNEQCETYGLPFEMVFNGSMEEIYTDNSTNVNDVEKGETENVQN